MADNEKQGRLKSMVENIRRIRIKGKPNNTMIPNTANTPSDLVNIALEIENNNGITGNLSDLQDFRTLSFDAEARYRVFDEMEMDSVISSALDMYADDATQYNADGNVIWAESEDSDIKDFANRLIDIFQLNRDTWGHIRSLIKYGDLFLETYRDDEKEDDSDPYGAEDIDGTMFAMKVYRPKIGSILEEYIQKVDNPATIYELNRKGKTVGYVKTIEDDTNSTEPKYNYQMIQVSNDDILLPSDKYVHIYLPSNDRFNQVMDLELLSENGDNNKILRYKVIRGKSILHDLYKTYKELRLMEDAILLNRVTRSSIIRILQIEMGDMPKSQARETLKRFKQIIEQKNFMDKLDGTYSSQASSGPIENCIYVPTYNGKGSISASNLGGDVDIKSIVDLDYFKQKLAGGLKIPLSYISGTAQENGLGGGTSLTKIDARYARTVKRIQNAYIQGITNLINIFALSKGLVDHINNFTIKMVSPTALEDADRAEELNTRIGLVDSMLGLLNSMEISQEGMKEIMVHIFSDYLDESEIADILEKEEIKSDDDNIDEFDSFGGGGISHSMPSGSFNDFDIGNDIPNDFSDIDTENVNTDDLIDDTDFGDFEDLATDFSED